MKVVAAAAVVALALGIPASASGKFKIWLSLSQQEPRSRVAVRATIRTDTPQRADCRMRLLAVAPGVDVYEALDAFVLSHRTRPAALLGFLVPIARIGPKAWRATLRFPRAGRWRLVVPNWCAGGYALPPPIVRLVVVR